MEARSLMGPLKKTKMASSFQEPIKGMFHPLFQEPFEQGVGRRKGEWD